MVCCRLALLISLVVGTESVFVLVSEEFLELSDLLFASRESKRGSFGPLSILVTSLKTLSVTYGRSQICDCSIRND